MLRKEDLDKFIRLADSTADDNGDVADSISSILGSPQEGLHSAEIRRLAQSLEMAHYSSTICLDYHRWAQIIHRELEGSQCLDFTHEEEWRHAIAAAKRAPLNDLKSPKASRAQRVGEACNRLIKRGRKLKINAFGPEWDDRSLIDACKEIEVYVRRLGGPEVTRQIGAFHLKENLVFKDIWLFGEKGLNIRDDKSPSPPFGWLLALTSKYANCANSCRKPEVTWKTLISLSSDVAATFDCERYGQFEHLKITPTEVDRAVRDTLVWRTLFSCPQTPLMVLPYLKKAFETELVHPNDISFSRILKCLWTEFDLLQKHLVPCGMTQVKRRDAERDFPKLLQYSFVDTQTVNAGFETPIGSSPRDDTRYVLLGQKNGDISVRPKSFSVHAFCETVFTTMWELLPQRASEVSGKVIEQAIYLSCLNKAELVQTGLKYKADGKDLEFDIICKSEDKVTLFECKAKPLTAKAQTGDTLPFYRDYAQSFLSLVHQLARHERHIKSGEAPISVANSEEFRIEKVAVSPVAYGPVGDRIFQTALQEALFNRELSSTGVGGERACMISTFNEALSKAHHEILQVAKNEKGEFDLHRFLIFTHWLDLGQIIFALNHTNTVHSALGNIRHTTFQTRDFWTDFAFSTRLRNSV